jgi:hypothetical protein
MGIVAGVDLVGVKELVDGLHGLQQLLLHELKLDEDEFGDLAGEEGADGPPQLPLVLDGHLLHVHVLGQPPPLILAQQRLAWRMQAMKWGVSEMVRLHE